MRDRNGLVSQRYGDSSLHRFLRYNFRLGCAAAGFSLDLKALVATVPARPLLAAIRAPWGRHAGLQAAIAALRSRGEIVVCSLPGCDSEVDEFVCDRELIEVAGHWVVQAVD